jgi:hypothetical protein
MTTTEDPANGCRSRRRQDRGQSHAIGFVLVLTIGLGTIAGGAYYGLQGLQDASSAAPAETAEASLATVQNDYYELSSGSPYRSMNVELYDAQLYYGPPIKMSVKAQSNSGNLPRKQVEFRPLIIESSENYYIFSGGAIIRSTGDGAYIKEGPRFRIDDTDAYLPLFESSTSNPNARAAVSGSQTVPVSAYKSDSTFTAFEPSDGAGNPETIAVEIRVKSPRANAWATYFTEDSRFSNPQVKNGGTEVTAEFQTKHLYVRTTTVETELNVE